MICCHSEDLIHQRHNAAQYSDRTAATRNPTITTINTTTHTRDEEPSRRLKFYNHEDSASKFKTLC